MTETATTVVETVTARAPRRAIAGILSNIQRETLDTGTIVLASLTSTFRGIETTRTLSISGPAVEGVDHLLVEGAYARFYAELGQDYDTVIGPDLTKRTLAREALKATTVETPAPKAKRPVSEKQRENGRRFFAGVRAKAEANRQAKLAEQAA